MQIIDKIFLFVVAVFIHFPLTVGAVIGLLLIWLGIWLGRKIRK